MQVQKCCSALTYLKFFLFYLTTPLAVFATDDTTLPPQIMILTQNTDTDNAEIDSQEANSATPFSQNGQSDLANNSAAMETERPSTNTQTTSPEHTIISQSQEPLAHTETPEQNPSPFYLPLARSSTRPTSTRTPFNKESNWPNSSNKTGNRSLSAQPTTNTQIFNKHSDLETPSQKTKLPPHPNTLQTPTNTEKPHNATRQTSFQNRKRLLFKKHRKPQTQNQPTNKPRALSKKNQSYIKSSQVKTKNLRNH